MADMQIDTTLCIGALFFFVGLPMFYAWMELRARAKYPIRVRIAYTTGMQSFNQRPIVISDRIGYVEVKNEKDAGTGAKEWRLRKLKKPVLNFNLDYVSDEKIWFGLKKAQVAYVMAVMGEKGEEFRPMRFDPANRDYKPVFDGDRGMLFYKITQQIEARNKYENFWKQNLLPLIMNGLLVVIILLQLLTIMQLKDMVGAAGSAIQSGLECSQNIKDAVNSTLNKAPATGTLGGVPFAFGTPGG
jgi:hypothetical protein